MKNRLVIITVVACSLLSLASGCRRKQKIVIPELPPPVISEKLSKVSPIRDGMNLIQVRDVLGKPEGMMTMGSIVVWKYDRGTVEFEDGVVTVSTILSDYDYAMKKALEEQKKTVEAIIAANKEPEKKKKKQEGLGKKIAEKVGLAGDSDDEEKESGKDERVAALTESLTGVLEQNDMVSSNSVMGKMSKKAVGAMLERELKKMPKAEREKLLDQFQQSSDAMRNYTNNLYRAFKELD